MIWALSIGGVIIFVAASALFSGAETGLYCVNRLRLRLADHRGDLSARRLQTFLDDEQGALATTLTGTNLANYLTTVSVALLLSRQSGLSDSAVELYTTAIVTPLLFVCGEVVPKNLFQRDADRLLCATGPVLLAARRVFAPVVWCLRILSARLIALFDPDEGRPGNLDDRRRIALMLREAMAGGDPAGEHGAFVDRALNLPDTPVHAVMVPWSAVAALPAEADREEFLRRVKRVAHSRLPVYRDDPHQAARVTGVVHVPTLLADDTWQRAGDRALPVVRLGPADPVSSALIRVQQSGQPMALVVGPHGACLGIVTLKDLLEEIVGELAAW
ncbi:MAG: DUF21 domain-containing protein [Planctomycetes bacterium]|nr:DUF21 domain-containing protein [Planctomycetota bacterium]